MKLTFIGCGSAFTTKDYWQSNMIIEADDGARLLVDCGSDARFALADAGIKVGDIDGVYISHLHADHIGGIEWLAFARYFSPNPKRPILFANADLMDEMWEKSLRGGLESIQGKVVDLTEYFDCQPIEDNGAFEWHGLLFHPVQTVHVVSGRKIKHSFGLLIATQPRKTHLGAIEYDAFITTDTQFCPNSIYTFYDRSAVIFQDCETAPFKSGVHAHYDDLKTLNAKTKAKMWLYHYQPNPPQALTWEGNIDKKDMKLIVERDGFAGFVKKGQTFEIPRKE